MVYTEKAPQSQPKKQQQQDPAVQPPKKAKRKHYIAEKVSGTVVWFNVRISYGFINRNDTKEDVFVHENAIVRNNPRKATRSLGAGEAVEFAVVAGKRGHKACKVTGPGGKPVKGSPFAADKPRGFNHQYHPRQDGGRGGEGAPQRRGRVWRRGPQPTQGGAQGDEGQEGAQGDKGQEGTQGGEGQEGAAATQPQRYFSRNFRGGRRGAGGPGGLNRGGLWRMRPRNNYQGQGEEGGANQTNGREALGAGAGRGAKPKPAKPAGATTNESQA